MIFNIFINFFEDFVLNCFLAKSFNVKNKFQFAESRKLEFEVMKL